MSWTPGDRVSANPGDIFFPGIFDGVATMRLPAEEVSCKFLMRGANARNHIVELLCVVRAYDVRLPKSLAKELGQPASQDCKRGAKLNRRGRCQTVAS